MPVVSTFSVDGFPDLFRTMEELKEEIGKGKTDRIWRDSLKAAMQPVLDAVKSAAPRDSGQLASNIYMKVHRPQNRDKQGKYFDGEIYMARVSVNPIRHDTEAHTVLNRRGKLQTVYKNKRPVAISQEFGNARNPAHPFLRVSLERNSQTVLSILENTLRIKIEEIAKAKAKKGG